MYLQYLQTAKEGQQGELIVLHAQLLPVPAEPGQQNLADQEWRLLPLRSPPPRLLVRVLHQSPHPQGLRQTNQQLPSGILIFREELSSTNFRMNRLFSIEFFLNHISFFYIEVFCYFLHKKLIPWKVALFLLLFIGRLWT